MVRYVIVVIILAVTSLAYAKPVEEYDWIEVRTGNFVIHSLLSQRQTVKAARYFELLRKAIPASVLPWKKDKPVPATVYLLRSPKQINELGYMHDAEHYSDSGSGNFILIGADVYAFYEVGTAYLQYLLGSRSTPEHVIWYEKGLIGLFRNSRISDGMFLFGQTSGSEFGSQRSIDRLFSDLDHTRLSRDRRRTLAYDSSALVRMLIEEEQGLATFGPRLGTYVEMTDQGMDPRQAFESAFGIPVEELEERLKDFTINRCCNEYLYPLESLLPEFNPEVRDLPQAEVALGLGRVALSLDAHRKARDLFSIAHTGESTRAAAIAELEQLEQKNTRMKCPECSKNSPKDLEYRSAKE